MQFPNSLLFAILLPTSILAADSSTPKPPKPCTIHSPITGSYFDLRTIQVQPPSASSKKDARIESWHSRGYDYGANFTINFCGPVIEDLGKVEGLPKERVANVSAFYKMNDKTYSIGQTNTEPIFRGRKLVLNYTDGSPCPTDLTSMYFDYDSLAPREILTSSTSHSSSTTTTSSRLGNTKPTTLPSSPKGRTKSTILSFLCDRDPQYTEHPTISFVGTPDSCTYFFEVRSRAACGGASSQSPSSLGPAGVFLVILGIAVVVYLVGGVAYQRTVMHQRGWRQCPNWGVWRGLGELVGDTFTIVTSSLSRHIRLPTSFNRAFNAGGYHRVGDNNPNGSGDAGFGRGGTFGGQGRGRPTVREEDENNRLIDQLDEEWDD